MAPQHSRQHRQRPAWRRARTLGLAALACGAFLVPLHGDPRATPVTHPLWARLLLRALDLEPAVRASAQASQVFAALAWRDSLVYPADRFARASEAIVSSGPDGAVVSAGRSPAEVTYALAVVQPGRYQLRARLAGSPELAATAELVPLEGGVALDAFALPLPGASAWVSGGPLRLVPGAYGARFLLPPGGSLAQVEIAPPCLHPIEPPAGWQPDAPTTRDDLAVTALQALDREDELAPAAVPIELDAAAFQVEPPAATVVSAGLPALALVAGPGGLRGTASIDLPEAGLYVVSALGAPGAGQRWLFDSCRSAAVCAAGSVPGWHVLASQVFAAGRHTLEVTLGDGASLQALRLELKKSRPADYLAALERLGLRAGPEGPVSRATALDAARFVHEQRRAALVPECLAPLAVEPGTTLVADRGTAPPPPLVSGPVAGPVPPPTDTPILPPQQVATPTLPGSGS